MNMLTKIGVAALVGTIGTAALGGVANANEVRFVPPPNSSVTVVAPRPVVVAAPPVASPVVTPAAYGYADGYRPGVYYTPAQRARMERERLARERAERLRRERARAEWLRHHHGYHR
jgi:hypothetical protein